MAAQKKILVSIPEELLREADKAAARQGVNRSEFIRRAMRQSVDIMHTMEKRERMRRGYQEMAGINLEWAEMGLERDREVLNAYEEYLSECERNDHKR